MDSSNEKRGFTAQIPYTPAASCTVLAEKAIEED